MILSNLKDRLNNGWCLLKETGAEFIDNNTFQKGAALSYYTVFALPPIVVIMITIAGVILGPKAVAGEIYYQIKGMIGSNAALQLQEMVENIHRSTDVTFAAAIGIVTLLIGATGVFISMQDSLNEIWGVKPKPRHEYLKLLLDRLLSFAMIMSITFLLLVSLVINALLVALGSYLTRHFAQEIIYLIHLLNILLSLTVITILFAAIFKYLPDAKIKWSDVWVGALVTALLFALGRYIISFYLGSSDFASVYGATGSVIIILVWSFYTSQILFFGAIFTLVYSRRFGSNIYPSTYAVKVERQEIEVGKSKVNAPGKHQAEIWQDEKETNETPGTENQRYKHKRPSEEK